MGNPYYIPPGEAPLSGMTRNILALAELKQRSDLARMGLDQDAARLKADQDYRAKTLAQGEEQNALAREQFYAETPTAKPYDAKTHVKARMAVKTLGLEGSGVEKYLDSAQENGFTLGQIHSGLKTPQMHRQIKNHVQEQLIKNSEVAGFAGSPQETQLNDILEAIDSPDNYNAFVDGMFPEVAQYNATVEAENQRKTAEKPATLYKTEKGFLPADQATGLKPWQEPKDNSNEPLIPVDNGDGTVTYTPKSQVRGMTVRKTGAQATEKSLIDAESNILNPNIKKPEVAPYVDFFNSNSTKGYVYQYKIGDARYNPITNKRLWGEESGWKRVKLPVVNGKQVTAKDVADTANARGKSYDEALNRIFALAKEKGLI